jgi:hypothetical protein
MNQSPSLFKYQCPLRASRPADLIHPEIREVLTLRESLNGGIFRPTNGDSQNGLLKEGKESLQLIESNNVSQAAATPAASSASEGGVS